MHNVECISIQCLYMPSEQNFNHSLGDICSAGQGTYYSPWHPELFLTLQRAGGCWDLLD